MILCMYMLHIHIFFNMMLQNRGSKCARCLLPAVSLGRPLLCDFGLRSIFPSSRSLHIMAFRSSMYS